MSERDEQKRSSDSETLKLRNTKIREKINKSENRNLFLFAGKFSSQEGLTNKNTKNLHAFDAEEIPEPQ